MDALDRRELSRRRRAIVTGLKGFLPEGRVLEAVILWERDFSSGPMFALHNFISLLCDTQELRAVRGDIHRNLLWALSLEAAQLEPDPGPRIEAYLAQHRGAAGESGQSLRSEALVVFAAVFASLFRGIDEAKPPALLKTRVYVMEHLAGLGLPKAQSQGVACWLGQQADAPPEGLALEHMRGLLHLSYVAACQYLGPVLTDRLMAAAIREAEGLAAARWFSPRDLL